MKTARHYPLLVLLVGGTCTTNALAIDYKLSGFAQVVAGRVLSGKPTAGQTADNPYSYSAKPGENYRCPCFVANYERPTVYEFHETSAAPETLAGVQADISFTPSFGATVQTVARAGDGTLEFDWAYASLKLAPNLTLQAGRKRLPLYYYSDYMYVGYAYPWIRPNQDLYAWQIYSYDGANLLYNTSLGHWDLNANVWIGSRHTKDNDMLGKLYYTTQIDEKWKSMVGGYVELSDDIFNLRGVYMNTKVDRYAVAADGTRSPAMSGEGGRPENSVGQAFYGLSLNADYHNWIVRTEMNYVNRPSVKNNYLAQSYSGGYQFGNHLVMLSWGKFRERAAYWPDGVEIHTTRSISYRWDFSKSQAFKLQLDSIKDETKFLFTGDARLLSAAWNIVF